MQQCIIPWWFIVEWYDSGLQVTRWHWNQIKSNTASSMHYTLFEHLSQCRSVNTNGQLYGSRQSLLLQAVMPFCHFFYYLPQWKGWSMHELPGMNTCCRSSWLTAFFMRFNGEHCLVQTIMFCLASYYIQSSPLSLIVRWWFHSSNWLQWLLVHSLVTYGIMKSSSSGCRCLGHSLLGSDLGEVSWKLWGWTHPLWGVDDSLLDAR